MTDIDKIAEAAEVIIGGYAVISDEDGNFCVVNMNRDGHACLVSPDYEIIQSSMDEIEEEIAKDQLRKARKYMEVKDA